MKNIEKLFYIHKIKLPPLVEMRIQENSLFFKGPLGFLEINVEKIDSLGLGFLNMNKNSNELEIYVKKVSKGSKTFCGSLLSFFHNNIYGICQGFLIYLELVGVGFRAILHENKMNLETPTGASALIRGGLAEGQFQTVNTSIRQDAKHKTNLTQYELGLRPSLEMKPTHTQNVLSTLSPTSYQQIEFKIGQSHDIFYQIPKNIRAFSVKPTLFCLYGLDKQQITQIAAEIRNMRSPEPYKGKGIRYKDEIVRIKVGKKK